MNVRRGACLLAVFPVVAFAVIVLLPAPAPAAGTSVLKGLIRDGEGKPVEGAAVFVYTTENTRRPPDFQSPASDRNGRYAVELPHGRYWVVARAGRERQTGPLLSDGRHSGDPSMIDLPRDRGMVKDFTVASLREAARMNSRTRADVVTISGRIIDRKGAPVKGACLVVYQDREGRTLPDYLSAWTGEDGRYDVSLPPGTYCVGASTEVPLTFREGACRRIDVTASMGAADIVMTTREEK